MELLTKPIESFSFQDIETFCSSGEPEGTQIDYKEDYPAKGLAKHIAAMSNTRGGIIILGVEEDKISGKPIQWKGLPDDVKLVERLHQEIGNVSPLPHVRVHKTNVNNSGNVFILVRIFEGDKTPYYKLNDPNIWIRTGSVNKSIDIASPEWTELLVGKEQKAKKARDNYLQMAMNIYNNGLIREDWKRKKRIGQLEREGKTLEVSDSYRRNLGSQSIMCEITVQPYFPHEALTSPMEIKNKIRDFSFSKGFSSFPDLNVEPMPKGIFNFQHDTTGFIECQQIYSQGLIYHSIDVLKIDDGKRIIYISYIAGALFNLLACANLFYKQFGYQGVLVGSINLMKTVETQFREIGLKGRFPREIPTALLPNYEWELNLDTEVLNSEDKFLEFFLTTLREVYWSLGYEHMNDQIIINFLKEERFIS